MGCAIVSAQPAAATAAAPATSPAPSPAPSPATVPADQSTPKAALKTFSRALETGDASRVRELLSAEGEHERELAEATVTLAEASAQLARAASSAFGDERARPLGVDPHATEEAIERIDAATEKIDGESATLRIADSDDPAIVLVRRNGKWRVPVAELMKNVEAADVQRNVADMIWQAKQMRELSEEVSTGKYATAAEARQALDRRIMERSLPPLRSTTAPTTRK